MSNNPKILIPLIRKLLPTLMAQQIVGVQPMSDIETNLTSYLK